MSRHKLVQRHEASGRLNLYIASHVHHLERLEAGDSEELVRKLYEHATKPEFCVKIEWVNDGDLIMVSSVPSFG